MYYEFFLVLLLIVCLSFPFIYSNFWKPRIVNRTKDFFVVSKIERMTLTFKKGLFIYGSFMWIALLYDDAYQVLEEGTASRSGVLIVKIALLCIWNIIMLLCCRDHVALPLRQYLDAEEMIKSIESERFHQIGKNLWYSQNWIRVSTKFYPKSIVTDISISASTRKNALASIIIHTIPGKAYRCNDFSYYDKTLHEKVDRLVETLPICSLTDLNNRTYRNRLRDFKGHDIFNKYMETHTTTEFVNNPELLSSVISIIQKRMEVLKNHKWVLK